MRTLTKLCIAAMAAMALAAATGPATASATSAFFAESYPATVTGETPYGIVFSRGSVSYTCEASPFEGAADHATGSLAVSVAWGKCHKFGGEGAYPETNGCQFIFHPGPEEWEGPFRGTMDIGPADCGPIVIDIPGDTCPAIEIVPQTGLTGVSYENEGSGSEATIEFKPQNVAMAMSSPPKTSCATTVHMTANWTASAETDEGGANGFYAVDLGEVGAFVNEEEEVFDAEAFPVTLGGTETGTHEITRGSRVITCDSVEGIATELSEAKLWLGVSTAYDECSSNLGGPVTVAMNGCEYIFIYYGETLVECPKGEEIDIDAYLSQKKFEEGSKTCRYSIAPQEATGTSYSTVGAGSGRGIEVDSELGEMLSTRTFGSGLLCGPLESTNMTYTGGLTLFTLEY